MSPRVTAIIVARNGAEHLPRTLDSLAEQSRRADAVIAVDCGSTDGSGELLAAAGPTHLVSTPRDLPFGRAVAAAVSVLAPAQSDDELLWLIAQDNAPSVGALTALVAMLETSPSVAVVGPKQKDWATGDFIHSFGQSITRYGATVELVSDELDQGQRDNSSDVLAVAAGGMLVRRTVWDALTGFDPALPVVDDALDFCIRARLAGHRVSVAAAAEVAAAGDGVAGANTSHRGRPRRRRMRQERTSQLRRRLAYASAATLPLHWLTLVPLAILRSIWALLGKEPSRIGGEFLSAFLVAFTAFRAAGSRRRLKAERSLGWTAISALRVSPAEMRRRRALEREARVAMVRGARTEIGFFSSGGAWTLLAAIVVGVVVIFPMLGASAVVGGGVLPLSGTPAELWQNVGYGWRDIGTGFTGAADPFAAVLAVLGSITFWSPSLAVLVLYIAAVPLAALGAWFAASRITQRGSLRAIAAVLWMLAPPLLSAMADGRVAAVITHLLLPWLVFAAFSAARSWSAAATSALLFAAVCACSPSIAPALLIAWFVLLVTSGRRIIRLIFVPIPAVVLLAPLVIDQTLRGNWLAAVADPGVALAARVPTVLELLLGLPAGDAAGWAPVVGSLPVSGIPPTLLVAVLLAPIGILALIAMFLRGWRIAMFALALALVGFATAVATTLISVSTHGSQPVPLWAGPALSLYWLAVSAATVCALGAIRRIALLPGIVATAMFVGAVGPLALAIPLGTSPVQATTTTRILPAFVTAAAVQDPRAGTLVVTPQPDGGVSADLQRGAGTTLDDQSALAATDTTVSSDQRDLAIVAGNLISRSGLDTTSELDARRIRYIVLAPAAREVGQTETSTAAGRTATRAGAALDGNAELVPVGRTSTGTLWRVADDESTAGSAAVPVGAGGWRTQLVITVLAIVFGATLLLSIPTGVGREARVDVAGRRRRLPLVPEPTLSDEALDDWEEPEDEEIVPVAASSEIPAESGEESEQGGSGGEVGAESAAESAPESSTERSTEDVGDRAEESTGDGSVARPVENDGNEEARDGH